MTTYELISSLWPIGFAFIGLITWLVRLEGQIKQSESSIRSLDKRVDGVDRNFGILNTKHEALDSRLVTQLGEVRESLARIEGALSVRGEN